MPKNSKLDWSQPLLISSKPKPELGKLVLQSLQRRLAERKRQKPPKRLIGLIERPLRYLKKR